MSADVNAWPATPGAVRLGRFVGELRAREQDRFFDQVARQRQLGRVVLASAAWVVVSSAMYGWTFGLWRSGLLGMYVAVKLPILLMATTTLVMALNWMLGQLMDSGLRMMQVAALTMRAMAAACLILLALSPLSWFLAISWPPPSQESAFSHNVLLLLHVLFIGAAGLAGNATMMRGLRRLTRPGCRIRSLYAAWLATHVFVGCQLSWILRPFVGSPNYPVRFLRENALDGNFYEFVFGVVLRDLFR